MHQCPKCKSEDIHRSRPRARLEKWRKEITGRRPFRCHECGWRGWGIDRGPKFGDEAADLAARAVAPVPPNLKGTALAREDQRAGLNLEQLDTFDHPFDKRK